MLLIRRRSLLPAADPRVDRFPSRQLGLSAGPAQMERWLRSDGVDCGKAEGAGFRTMSNKGASFFTGDTLARATTGRGGTVYLFDSGEAPY
ncbi:hypothetical protein EAH83_13385 [Variovorax ginsengisoli]|uniref:Uncharacterized protein n=1 Tax=Variovorax guangxiensis TaxID=1775474 RepID=A0A502DQN3_9BURK|nr:hypothetical protein EAH83_13385 [Variovorax ginsengisoli]TPG27687.1 hypothetical protein EAH82_13045 [Variovorax guangxiensis]